jgi:hypothetical protein
MSQTMKRDLAEHEDGLRDLFDASTRLVQVIDMVGLLRLSEAVPLGPISWFCKASDARAWVNAELDKWTRKAPQ